MNAVIAAVGIMLILSLSRVHVVIALIVGALVGGLTGGLGIDATLKQRADEAIRLSSLTLPHAMARLVLCEQLYRAQSVVSNHPYHREG